MTGLAILRPTIRAPGQLLGARVLVLMLGPLLAVAAQGGRWGGGRAWWRARARAVSTGPEDFDAVVLVHIDAAYNLARYLTGDVELAEDIVQDALLKAYRGFPTYRGDNAKAWLLTIVRRGFIDWSNARRAGRAVFSEAETAEDAGDHVADPSDSAEALLLRAADVSTVQRALQALPEPFRESLILREIEGLSYREVAEMTGVPQGTVMSRLARGRELLARMLRAASISEESR
ncbi:sigma-70 family RNA polymerase sigma factor [Caulobacter sp. 1776]|uniref:sigma-70 family RNA polymerase sigma factor n=1 Tax=Caulobacter sp. 1776 TaxID=3156420 RepID=UPI003394AA44